MVVVADVLFLPVRHYASAGISRRLSVCLCVSVTRRYCIKRLNIRSCKQRHMIAQGLSFLTPTVFDGRLAYP